MALILGTSGTDVLAWRGTSELLEDIRKTFSDRASLFPYQEGTKLLVRFRDCITDEIQFEKSFSDDLDQVLGELAKSEFDDELAPLQRRLKELAASYFEKRSSVIALHVLCTASLDLLLRKIIFLSEAALQDEAEGAPTGFCWLVAGEGGRQEQTLTSGLQLLLVYDDATAAPYFDRLCYRVTSILKKAGLISGTERDFLRTCFWHGSRKEWLERLSTELFEKKPGHFLHLPMLNSLGSPFRPLNQEDHELYRAVAEAADLRILLERDDFGTSILSSTRSLLQRFSDTDPFEHVGRQVAVLPVALTLFGRFRVERRGRSRGTFNVRQHALDPLVMNVTLLAVKNGIDETGTIGRIRRLLDTGRISVDMAERVIHAFHEIVRLEMFAHLKQSDLPDYGCVDPDRLAEEDSENLKQALEVVISLQKSLLHDFLERM